MSNLAPHIHTLERRFLTVMFVDMVQSSELLRKMEIEAAERLFREVISGQIRICEAHGGTVNQVMGDGLMCLFGAEPPYEDHAFRALAAADQMLENIKALRHGFSQRQLRIRIGINTGEVILQRAPEASYRSRYQVLGETVHIADRILKMAEPDTALISPASQRQVERFFELKKSKQLNWDSKKAPLQLYVKKGVMPAQPFADAKVVVRADDVARLLKYMTETQAAGLKISCLRGEAGFGKTFIVRQILTKTAHKFFANVIGINFYPHPVPGKNRLEADIIAKILPKATSGWGEVVRDNAALRLVGDEDFILSCLFDTVGENFPAQTAYHTLDGGSRARVRRLVTNELLRQFCAKNETLIVLEDLHWAGKEEIRDIESLLTACSALSRVQVLCTSRGDAGFVGELQQRVKEFALEPLSMEQSRSLLDDTLKKNRISPALAKSVCTLSGGNPYFVREYGLWVQSELRKNVPPQLILKKVQGQAPQEIVNVLYAKLENLDKPTIEIARTASIQGLNIDPDMLAALAGISQERARDGLGKLRAAGILSAEGDAYSFSHELLQRVIYNSVTKSTRMMLHRAAIRHLRGALGAPGVRRMMAYHAEQAQDPVLQYIYAKDAAREAKALSRHTEAVVFLKSAASALAQIKRRGRSERHLVRLKFHEIESLFITGHYALVKKRLDYVLAHKGSFPGRGMLKEALSYQGLYFWIMGEIPKAEKTYLAILKASRQDDDRETFIRESARLSHVCIDLGEYQRSLRHSMNALEAMTGLDLHAKCGLLTEIGPTVFSCLALAYGELGDRKNASFYGDKALALLAESQDYFTRIYTCSFVGSSRASLGDNEAARQLSEKALAACNVVQSVLLKPYALSTFGLALARTGAVEEGARQCAAALDLAHRSGLALRRSLFHIRYAEALMRKGQQRPAMKHLRRAIKCAAAAREKSRLRMAQTLMQECYALLPEGDERRQRNVKYFEKPALPPATQEAAVNRPPKAKRS